MLTGASLIASFFAGVAALFAPCCITVLLPTYFASIFKQKVMIFLMTFVYFLGLLVVFMPLGLGATLLSQFFSSYHNTIFSLGGIFLVLLGATLIAGKQFTLPITVHPELKNYDVGSIFVLGVFSGIATTCCAPVLAGVLALSLLPGSFILGPAYILAYVSGMVIPLFVIALFIDKTNLTQKVFVFRKTISYSILSQRISTTLSSLFSGVMFLALGIIILFLAETDQLISHSSYQLTMNIYLAKLTKSISTVTGVIPDSIWGFFFVGLFLVITWFAIRQVGSLLEKNKISKGSTHDGT